jgi:glycosyltransferase involved in cell wall biosynthesis
MPRFSVIVPCYNQAPYLPQAVASVIAQGFTDWELIIVDDGSHDDTAAVAEGLIATYPDRTIHLLRQANAGLEGARNAGISAARGELIMPLDADDALAPQMLERTAAIFDADPAIGFVYSDVYLFGEEEGHVVNRPFDARRMRVICLLHAISPFRRTAWAQVGGYRMERGRGYEDWDFWLSLIEAGWKGRYIPEMLARYRRSGGGMLERVRRYDLELRALLVNNHPGLYEPAYRAWAAQVARPNWCDGWVLRPHYWPIAFLWYNLLIIRYDARELPRTLLRPLYWRLPTHTQKLIRRLSRVLLR